MQTKMKTSKKNSLFFQKERDIKEENYVEKVSPAEDKSGEDYPFDEPQPTSTPELKKRIK